MSLVDTAIFPQLRAGTTYLDSAATSLRPRCVIDAVARAMEEEAFSPHASSPIAHHGWELREAARARIARFLDGAPDETVFVRGTTEALNVLADGVAPTLAPGDRIVITVAEHRANALPWVRVAERCGAELVVAPLGDDLVPDVVPFIDARTRVVAVGRTSNVTGRTLDLAPIVRAARAVSALVFVDGAQSIGEPGFSVREEGIDAFAFSGHKVHGPSGVGVLWARKRLLDRIEPRSVGGHTEGSAAARHEAGTPAFEAAVGLSAALDFVDRVGRRAIARHRADLARSAADALSAMSHVRVIASGGAIVTFVVRGVHAHDVATVLGARGVMVRSGRLCAEPLLAALGVDAVVRASFAMHSSERCVHALVDGVAEAAELAA